MSKTRADLPYSQPVQVFSIKSDTNVILRPDAETRDRIARFAGLHALPAFKAEMVLKPRHDGSVVVAGTLEADVEPVCVVSLEPFADHVSELIDATFSSEDVIARLVEKLAAEDDEDSEGTPELPDPIVNGAIDPAALGRVPDPRARSLPAQTRCRFRRDEGGGGGDFAFCSTEGAEAPGQGRVTLSLPACQRAPTGLIEPSGFASSKTGENRIGQCGSVLSRGV